MLAPSHAPVLGAVLAALAPLPLLPCQGPRAVLGGGSQMQSCGGADLTRTEREALVLAIEAFESAVQPLSKRSGASAPYQTFPMGVRHGHDGLLSLFVDLVPGPGFRDFDCGTLTYEGHDGDDMIVRTFDEQDVGVPVFAAQDGIVVSVHDGEPDKNTVWAGQTANHVVIDHGNGRMCYYWHLRRNSIAVAPGQTVPAGEQIAQVGSSGASNHPHLHFGSYDGSTVYEPFAGPCRPGSSGWIDGPESLAGFAVLDFSTSRTDPSQGGGPPYPMPRSGQVEFADTRTWLWIQAANLPANSTWQVAVERPNGSLAYSSGSQPFGNPGDFRWSWWYWWVDVPQMHTLAGTWRLELQVNGVQRLQVPVEVVAQVVAGFNRPPEPVDVRVEPIVDGATPAVCRVLPRQMIDDPDHDVLRYRYRWRVSGVVVRDTVSAGLKDVLASTAFQLGDTVQCTVTVSDGQLEALPAADARLVGTGPRLAFPAPGLAGQVNTLVYREGPPRAMAVLVFGLGPGATPIPGCPGLDLGTQVLGLLQIRPLGFAGDAVFPLSVPASALGLDVFLAVATLAPCSASNLVVTSFR